MRIYVLSNLYIILQREKYNLIIFSKLKMSDNDRY